MIIRSSLYYVINYFNFVKLLKSFVNTKEKVQYKYK